jgi:hypothetical protein
MFNEDSDLFSMKHPTEPNCMSHIWLVMEIEIVLTLVYLYLLMQSSLNLNLHLEGFAYVHRPNRICKLGYIYAGCK